MSPAVTREPRRTKLATTPLPAASPSAAPARVLNASLSVAAVGPTFGPVVVRETSSNAVASPTLRPAVTRQPTLSTGKSNRGSLIQADLSTLTPRVPGRSSIASERWRIGESLNSGDIPAHWPGQSL